jgi:uncharacterized protein (UPF0276 family)
VITTTSEALARIPAYGAGVRYQDEWKEPILDSRAGIDFLEISVDYHLETDPQLRLLRELCAHYPVVPHGIALSLGSAHPPDREYLRRAKRVSDLTGSPYYSEHLAVTNVPGLDLTYFLPLWLTGEMLEIVIRNVRIAQDILEKPLVVENMADNMVRTIDLGPGTQSETAFLRELADATDCGVLLDVTNVYINAVNSGRDPEAVLRAMPLDRVVQVHLAGAHLSGARLEDRHAELVQEEIWALFGLLTSLVAVKGTIVEHEDKHPGIEVMRPQLDRIRAITAQGAAR